MSIFLIILGSLMLLCLVCGYFMYRYVFIRRKSPAHPVAGTGKTPPRQYFNNHFDEGMKFLNEWGFEKVSFINDSGLKLVGYLFRSKTPTDKVALCIHGYHSAGIFEYVFIIQMYLNTLAMDVLVVDDRAHGDSQGKRIGFSWNDRLDCIQWVNWIGEHLGQDRQVILHGISMGAATVLNAAGDPTCPSTVRYVVEDCSYDTLKHQMGHVLKRSFHLPLFPLYYFMSFWNRLLNGFFCGTVDCMASTSRIKVPVLFIHGADDAYIPTSMVYKLYDACNTRKSLVIAPGARHAESSMVAPLHYLKSLHDFFE